MTIWPTRLSLWAFALTAFALVPRVCAEEAVMAWHLVGGPFTSGYPGEAVAEPPFATVFAEKGDKLIDVTSFFREQGKGADEAQVIWNETRKELIARGDATSLARVEELSGFQKQPLHAKVTVNWYEGVSPGEAVPTGKDPVASMTVGSRSGRMATSDWTPKEGSPLSFVSVEAEPQHRGGSGTEVDYFLQWAEPAEKGNLLWSLDSAISSNDLTSSPMTIAQVASPSGKRWSITLSTCRELIDGTPVAQSIRTEVAGKIVVVQRPAGPPKITRRGTAKVKEAEFMLAEVACPQALMAALFTPATPEDGEVGSFFSGFSEAVVPEGLRVFAGGPLIDCRKLFGRGGDHRESDLIGYSPQTGRILVASRAEEAIEVVDVLLTNGCFLETTSMSIHLKDGNRQTDMLLAGRSNQKVSLKCVNDDEETLYSAEVEAVIEENDTVVDLSYDLQFTKEILQNPARMSGKMLLLAGRETDLQTNRAGGDSSALTGKAEVFIGLEHR